MSQQEQQIYHWAQTRLDQASFMLATNHTVSNDRDRLRVALTMAESASACFRAAGAAFRSMRALSDQDSTHFIQFAALLKRGADDLLQQVSEVAPKIEAALQQPETPQPPPGDG